MADYRARWRIEGENGMQSAFRSILGDAQSTSNKMAGLFKAAFAGISVGAVVSMVSRSIEMGDELAKAALKSGIAAKAFTELAYAGRLADVDLGSLSTAIKKMQVTLSEAGSGAKTATATLAALGLEIKDLKALSPDKQFELLADRISQLKDPADRTRAAVELFGRAGADLLPLFEQGAEGIRKARLEAQAMGKSLSGEQLAQFQAADDAMKRLKESWNSFADSVILKAGPVVVGLMNITRQLLGGSTAAEDAKRQFEDLNYQLAHLGSNVDPAFRKFLEDQVHAAEVAMAAAGAYKSQSGGPQSRGRGTGRDNELPGFLPDPVKAAKTWRDEFDKAIAAFKFDQYLQAQYPQALEAELGRLDFGDDRMADMVQQQLDQISANLAESANEWTVYVDQAARNMQDSLARFLFDPFANGLDGMLKGFIDTLRQMAAELAASQIFKWLGSSMSGSSNAFIAGLGAAFAGKASGGPVSAGKPYLVGERGPELFMPRNSGTIIPNGGVGATVNVSAPLYIDARGATQDLIKQLPTLLQAHGQQVMAATRRAVREDVRRGSFGRS